MSESMTERAQALEAAIGKAQRAVVGFSDEIREGRVPVVGAVRDHLVLNLGVIASFLSDALLAVQPPPPVGSPTTENIPQPVQRFDLVSVSFAYTSDHEMQRSDDGEWVRFDDVFPPAALSPVEPTVHNDLCSWCLTQADHVAASEECYERNSERGRITTRPPVEPAGASEPPSEEALEAALGLAERRVRQYLAAGYPELADTVWNFYAEIERVLAVQSPPLMGRQTTESMEEAEATVIGQVLAHWFTQGGEARFGSLSMPCTVGKLKAQRDPANADELVSQILSLLPSHNAAFEDTNCELARERRDNDRMRELLKMQHPGPTLPDVTCEHGTAMDVHCCNCHSGFIFDTTHECPPPPVRHVATCETNGHVYGHTGACVFCNAPKPVDSIPEE